MILRVNGEPLGQERVTIIKNSNVSILVIYGIFDEVELYW